MYGLDGPSRIDRTLSMATSEPLSLLAGRYVLAGKEPLVFEVEIRDELLWFTMLSNRRSYRLWEIGPDTYFDINSGGTIVFERKGGEPSARATAMRFGLHPNSPTATGSD